MGCDESTNNRACCDSSPLARAVSAVAAGDVLPQPAAAAAAAKETDINAFPSLPLQRIKSPSLVGPYDAVTVHIRSGEQCTEVVTGAAKPVHNQHSNCVSSTKQRAFFEKDSFTSDIILNSRFHEEDGGGGGNVRTGEVLMCFLPPFDSGPYNHHSQNSNMNCTSSAAHAAGQQTSAQMAQHNSIRAMQEEAQRW